MPGVASAFYRMLCSALVLWIVWWLRGGSLPRSGRQLAWACLGGVFFAGDVGCYNMAVLRTGAGSSTFLGNNAPLVVGLLTWWLTRRVPQGRFWTALAVALMGAWLIVKADRHPGGLSNLSWRGDLLAVAASVCFAVYLLITERLRSRWGALSLITVSASASATALLGFALLAGTPLAVPSISAAGALVGLGFVCQVGGYFGVTFALGHLPATTSSVILLAVAPLTALLAYVLFGERMTAVQLLGGVFILVALWIVGRGYRVAMTVAEAEQTLS